MSDNFYRFPLALLALHPDDPTRTLDEIVCWCIGDVGIKTTKDKTVEEIREEDVWDRSKYSKELDRLKPKNRLQHQLIVGKVTLGVTGGSFGWMEKGWSDCQHFLNAHPGPAVNNCANLGNEWIWDCLLGLRDGKEGAISWREFRVLAALLSKIGSSKAKKCGWQEIQARSAGFAGKLDHAGAAEAERARRMTLILTQDQIRGTVASLEARKFFCRFAWRKAGSHGGHSWYSFSLQRGELAKFIHDSVSRAESSIAANRAADAALINGLMLDVGPDPN